MTSPPPTSAHLSIEGVHKTYDAGPVLDGIDLDVPAGAYVVLLGPSGSGKTTLLSIIGGFVAPSAGHVRIAGRDVTALGPARRPTATVFQDYALFPHMSVAGNVAFGLRHLVRAERARTVERMLTLVGLAGLGGRSVQALSGGQRQRVALARALAVGPAVLLLDEPLGALDLGLRRQMQDELLSLHRSTAGCFVHVTHDQDEAMALASHLVVMRHGRIEDAGPPERVYARPATRFTAGFMGESSQIEGHVGADGIFVGATGPLPVRTGLRGPAVAIIRPEAIVTGPEPQAPDRVALGTARLSERVFQGAHVRARAVTQSGQDFLLHLPPGGSTAPDDWVALWCSGHAITVVSA